MLKDWETIKQLPMLKSILNIQGVKELTKNEQKNFTGGVCGNCDPFIQCCARCRDGCFYYQSTCIALSASVCLDVNCSNCG